MHTPASPSLPAAQCRAVARAPPRKDALVEREAHGVCLRDCVVEAALHGAVRAHALENVACTEGLVAVVGGRWD